MRLTTVLISLLLSLIVHAEQTRIAVASNFTAPMKTIVAVFEQQYDYEVSLSFGSSGKLFAQIQNGAPYDVFLSADVEKPEALIKAGLASADSLFTYASGRLALWNGSDEDALALLKSGHYRKLAIANPRLAPYGSAAIQTLQQLDLLDQNKLVRGENISQTYQFVATGNTDLGFVAMSQIIKDGQAPASAWLVPDTLHDPIRQDAVLLTRGQDNEAAIALLDFLKSKQGRAIIEQYGYQTASITLPTGTETP